MILIQNPYTHLPTIIHKSDAGYTCAICHKVVTESRNLCQNGTFDSVMVCTSCVPLYQQTIDMKIAEYQRRGNELRAKFDHGLLMVTLNNCCNERIPTLRKKISKLMLPFRYDIRDQSDSITLIFTTDTIDDFVTKLTHIAKAKTRCGCSLVYGDGGTWNVCGYQNDVYFDVASDVWAFAKRSIEGI